MGDPRTTTVDETEVGSYFVANYPPFSVWTPEAVAQEAMPALQRAPEPGVPLGLYLHIPFCRKRCHFCYFRVYTDRNASEVAQYLDTLAREWELFAAQPAIEIAGLCVKYSGQDRKRVRAVDNVSLTIRHGETLGVIGRNGAGKSTILKLLSQITSPTSGEIRLAGQPIHFSGPLDPRDARIENVPGQRDAKSSASPAGVNRQRSASG